MAHCTEAGEGEPPDAIALPVAQDPPDYHGMEVLAPMVRAGTLALRMESLRYGAGLVYGEEIIDRKLIGCVRVENPAFGTIDFVSPREKVTVFSTCSEERSRVIFQMGTADPVLATQAATIVCNDVRGVDVNMGCPKSFSVKGGMGAAMLDKPEDASQILKALRRNVPSSCTVTCKIRMLATTQKTMDFMRVCEMSGISAIAVHLRQKDERPAHPAHWDEMVKLWDAVKIPVIANGDFFSRRQIEEFWRPYRSTDDDSKPVSKGPAALMIARGALWNPAIFCRGGTVEPCYEEVIQNYVRAAVRANGTYQNCKWVLGQMLVGGTAYPPPAVFRGVKMKDFNQQIGRAKSMTDICKLLEEPYSVDDFPAQAHTTSYYRNFAFPEGSDAGESSDKPTAGVAEVEAHTGDGESIHPSKRARVDE
eukprot:gnl/TRDRNA2_/TRDRNA2_164050_c0_seq1.p1 gnl/TRDRNA2_/TRDRNA2_164050_c0~~gnl/TRDRNA2_/TRDRNA2_164050_c0_seq1.p1  ORF type:complete len:421 (+),score=77.80 gnl/TRDRNA2_/TRDRNA2_164050_c0_seq1:76-1338(+)